jgi:hypothetical protein
LLNPCRIAASIPERWLVIVLASLTNGADPAQRHPQVAVDVVGERLQR